MPASPSRGFRFRDVEILAFRHVRWLVGEESICVVSANKLDIILPASYDEHMDIPAGKTVREAHPRVQVERKPLAQVWAEYIALDHKPKAEFSPSRTTPMQQERDRR
jgi:hypothetical protein